MERIHGRRIIYSFARKGRKRYLVVFNIYGGPAILQAIRVIAEGHCRQIFFIGSMGAKKLDVGTIVLPTTIIDKTGLVHIDSPGKSEVMAPVSINNKIREANRRLGISYAEGKIVSVPAPLHNMEHIHALKASDPKILGEEMELSTFYHFSKKDNLYAYALLYVSDNQRIHLTSNETAAKRARRSGLRAATRVALKVLP
jgi:Purine-nucleoside phosphorylase